MLQALRETDETSIVQEEPDSSALRRAELTLVALRAGLPDTMGLRLRGFAVDGRGPMQRVDVVAWLASLHKPVVCNAEVRNSLCWIKCASLGPDAQLTYYGQLRDLDDRQGVIGELRSTIRAPVDSSKILVDGTNESATVTLLDVEQWWREYLIDLPITLVRLDQETSHGDVDAVIGIGRHEPYEPEEGEPLFGLDL